MMLPGEPVDQRGFPRWEAAFFSWFSSAKNPGGGGAGETWGLPAPPHEEEVFGVSITKHGPCQLGKAP